MALVRSTGLEIYSGFTCNHCDDVSSVASSIFSTHLFNRHPGARTKDDPGYRRVCLQMWHRSGKHWTVTDPNNVAFQILGSLSADLNDDETSLLWEEKMVRK